MRLKTKFAAMLCVAGTLMLGACSSDLPEEPGVQDVPEAILTNFMADSPDAEGVRWLSNERYVRAEYTVDGTETEACYHLSTSEMFWKRRVIAFDRVPEVVRQTLAESVYGEMEVSNRAWRLTRYTHHDSEDFYEIQVTDPEDNSPLYLYYTDEGVLVIASPMGKLVIEDWISQDWSNTVTDLIASRYPGARCLYVHVDGHNGLTTVKILDGYTVRIVTVNADGQWVSTATELKSRDIPATVADSIHDAYPGSKIEKCVEFETADTSYYIVTIRTADRHKVQVRVEADGTVVLPDNGGNNNDTPAGDVIAANALTDFVLARYPEAVITDVDIDVKEAEIEALYNGIELEIEFKGVAGGYRWTGTEWDYDIRRNVPEVIAAAVERDYTGYVLSGLSYQEAPEAAPYYVAVLKTPGTHRTVKVKYDAEGNFLAEYSK